LGKSREWKYNYPVADTLVAAIPEVIVPDVPKITAAKSMLFIDRLNTHTIKNC